MSSVAVPSAGPVFAHCHAFKLPYGGVAVFVDPDRRVEIQRWNPWASDCPDMRQRYVTISGQTFKLLWHQS